MGNAAPQMLGRGIHTAKYLLDGHRALMAIDSAGNCIKRVKLAPEVHEGLARAFLEGLLDHYDPVPVRPKLLLLPSSPPLLARKWYLPRARIRR